MEGVPPPQSFNHDYFKTLRGRYKAQSELIQPEQTLYIQTHWSHRCVQANIAQQAMGHASLAVT